MDAALRAIAEVRRREILELLRDVELPAGDIAAHFPEVTRPAISQHLTILKQAGLIAERRDGTRRLYRARPEGFAELRAYLEHLWDQRLALLTEAAEREEEVRTSDGKSWIAADGDGGKT